LPGRCESRRRTPPRARPTFAFCRRISLRSRARQSDARHPLRARSGSACELHCRSLGKRRFGCPLRTSAVPTHVIRALCRCRAVDALRVSGRHDASWPRSACLAAGSELVRRAARRAPQRCASSRGCDRRRWTLLEGAPRPNRAYRDSGARSASRA
jgi:hypothetical protein